MRESDAILISIIKEFGECVFSHTKRASKARIHKDAIYYFYDAYWLCKADGSFTGPTNHLEALLKSSISRVNQRTVRIQSTLRTGDFIQYLSTSKNSEKNININDEIWKSMNGLIAPLLWQPEH